MEKNKDTINFDLTRCIGYVTDTSIKKVSEDFNRRLEAKGMTRIQWIALYYLRKEGRPLRQVELASRMRIKGPTLARLVDRMERDGLIRRVGSQQDKRVNELELTEFGLQRIDELLPIGEHFNEILLNGITDEEQEVFERVLAKLLANIKAE